MTKTFVKKNLSSMQVLRTLEVLLQGNFTMQELIAKLNINNNGYVFNNSVISKYINTCRTCGINIVKIHNKYFVTSMPFGLELTGIDTSLLENLQTIVSQTMAKKSGKIFDMFIEKLNRFSNKSITRVEKDNNPLTIELFDHAISEKRKIRLMFKNRAIMDCVPISIEEIKDKNFFHVLYNGKDKLIDMDRVSGLEVLTEKYITNFSEQVVVFKLYGNLAKNYCLRENERLIKFYDGHSITVSNHDESKDILLSRLMRYDNKCEIVNPKTYREDMIELIESTLNNYKV